MPSNMTNAVETFVDPIDSLSKGEKSAFGLMVGQSFSLDV
jgi:hypothetical protein